MIKQIAWETFKKTGNINTFLELKQLERGLGDVPSIPKNGDFGDTACNNLNINIPTTPENSGIKEST